MKKSHFTTNKDIVHVIKDNGKPIAVIINDQDLRMDVMYAIGKPMSGEDMGNFMAKLLPLPDSFEKMPEIRTIGADLLVKVNDETEA